MSPARPHQWEAFFLLFLSFSLSFFTLGFFTLPAAPSFGLEPAAWGFPSESESLQLLLESEELPWPCFGL